MPIELSARVEASVRGRSSATARGRGRSRLNMTLIVRLALVVSFVGAVSALGVSRWRGAQRLQDARVSLLAEVHAQSAALTDRDRSFLARAESWLEREAGTYAGDRVDERMRPPDRPSVFPRPMVYVRGPIEDFHDGLGIARAASESMKDPLLRCLLDPPTARGEAQLLAKVRAVHGEIGRAPDAYRLGDVEAGLPLLLPAWTERIEGANAIGELSALRRELARSSTEVAARAVKVGLLVGVMDEPDEGTGPTELDGEHRHALRVTIVDLDRDTVLLRQRKVVDPSWVSASKRAEYARAMDGCALAFDVLDAAGAPRSR
jgi:hypothetical protein